MYGLPWPFNARQTKVYKERRQPQGYYYRSQYRFEEQFVAWMVDHFLGNGATDTRGRGYRRNKNLRFV